MTNPQNVNAQSAQPYPPDTNLPGVSIVTFGAKAGAANVAVTTAAIQAAIDSGVAGVFIPSSQLGWYFTTLLMPTTQGFTLWGVGTGSQLYQMGAGIKWPVNNAVGYYNQTIKDIRIIGTNGTGNCIDTTYAGGVTINDIYILDIPATFDGIYINGSPTTYCHDVRVRGLQVYSNTAGNSGLRCGPKSADVQVKDMIMNGNFVVPYGVLLDDGAQTLNLSGSHVYNLTTNAVLANGNVTITQSCTFSDNTFDNCTQDIVVLNKCNSCVFDGAYIEAVQAGKNGIVLNNCSGIVITGLSCDGVVGAGYIVKETGTSTITCIIGGSTPALANFNNPPFLFLNTDTSCAKNFAGYTNMGTAFEWQGVTKAVIPINTTTYLGANGENASPSNTAFTFGAPSGHLQTVHVAADTAPGAGQTHTLTLYKDGAIVAAAAGSANPLILTNAAPSGSIVVAPGNGDFITTLSQVWIKEVSSATAAPCNLRYTINGVK